MLVQNQKLLSVTVCLPACLSVYISVFLSLQLSQIFFRFLSASQTFLCHYTELYYCIYYPLTASTTLSLPLLPPYCLSVLLSEFHCLFYCVPASTTSTLQTVLPNYCPSGPAPGIHCLYYTISSICTTTSLPLSTITSITRCSMPLVVAYCPFRITVTPSVPLSSLLLLLHHAPGVHLPDPYWLYNPLLHLLPHYYPLRSFTRTLLPQLPALLVPHCLYFPLLTRFSHYCHLYCPFRTSTMPLAPILALHCIYYPIIAILTTLTITLLSLLPAHWLYYHSLPTAFSAPHFLSCTITAITNTWSLPLPYLYSSLTAPSLNYHTQCLYYALRTFIRPSRPLIPP